MAALLSQRVPEKRIWALGHTFAELGSDLAHVVQGLTSTTALILLAMKLLPNGQCGLCDHDWLKEGKSEPRPKPALTNTY